MPYELLTQEEQITIYQQFVDYMSRRGLGHLGECAKQSINVEFPINMAFFPAVIFAGNEDVNGYDFGERTIANVAEFLHSDMFKDAALSSLNIATKLSAMGAVGHFAACATREFANDAIDSLELSEDNTYYAKLAARTGTGFLKYLIKYGHVKGGYDLVFKVIEGGVNQALYYLNTDPMKAEVFSGAVAPALGSMYDLNKGFVTLPQVSDRGVDALVGAALPTFVEFHKAVSPVEDYIFGLVYNATVGVSDSFSDFTNYTAGESGISNEADKVEL